MKTLVLALAVSAPILVALPARADVRVGIVLGGSGYRPGYRYADTFRYGYDRGFREGANNGFKAGRKFRRFDFYRDHDYRDADDGYKHWMGPRPDYESGFRRGYEAGYRQGYRQGRGNRYERHDRYDRDRYDDDVIYEIPERH